MSKIIQSCRQGFSLLEVLVSVFVVLIGLLGVATMIPAGRFEILQARKADMGADLSRAAMNCVITQISKGWQPPALSGKTIGYFVVANDNGELATRLSTGLGYQTRLSLCPMTVNDNRIFNGDDDIILYEGNDNQLQIVLDNGSAIGTGAYSACVTIVPLDNGYYEVTGLAVYRYENNLDANSYQRGSYVFCQDSTQKYRWYKIDNIYAARSTTISTAAGDKTGTAVTYLGDVIGICRKVIRIDNSYKSN